MSNQVLFWLIFNFILFAMLAVDLGVFHRRAHVIKIKEALVWSAVWISVSLLFNLGIYIFFGTEKAVSFLTGYLIEKSLSIDNIFVFIMIFSYFGVPTRYQHKVLFWGILAAIFMRSVFIIAGVKIILNFHFAIYIFGAFLIYTGVKMAVQKDKKINPAKNPILRVVKKFIPVTNDYENGKFFVKQNNTYHATPLLIVLLVIETTDLVFAVDSIPAILAITTDFPIVYTSNVFAILGLRALYFALAGITRKFHYLRHGLTIILIFVGVKMLISDIYKIPVVIALSVIASIVFISLIASVLHHHKMRHQYTSPDLLRKETEIKK